MKYFNISYWFKLLLLSAPLFSDQTKSINAMLIDKNKDIKNWPEKNTSCIHEAGHTINILNSEFEFIYMIVYPKNSQEYKNCGNCLGQSFYKVPSLKIEDYSDSQLLSEIKISFGGLVALIDILKSNFSTAYFSSNYDISLFNSIRSEMRKRKIISTFEDYRKLLLEKIIEIKQIIITNKLEINLIIETCNILGKVSKQDTDYIFKYKDLPLIAKKYKLNSNETIDSFDNSTVNSTIPSLDISEINSTILSPLETTTNSTISTI